MPPKRINVVSTVGDKTLEMEQQPGMSKTDTSFDLFSPKELIPFPLTNQTM